MLSVFFCLLKFRSIRITTLSLLAMTQIIATATHADECSVGNFVIGPLQKNQVGLVGKIRLRFDGVAGNPDPSRGPPRTGLPVVMRSNAPSMNTTVRAPYRDQYGSSFVVEDEEVCEGQEVKFACDIYSGPLSINGAWLLKCEVSVF